MGIIRHFNDEDDGYPVYGHDSNMLRDTCIKDEWTHKPQNGIDIESIFRPDDCPFALCPHTFMYCSGGGQCPSQ